MLSGSRVGAPEKVKITHGGEIIEFNLKIAAGGPYRIETYFRRGVSNECPGDRRANISVSDIYLIAGQSNAVGNGRDLFCEESDNSLHLFRKNGKCNAVYDEGELHTEITTDFSDYKKCDIAAVFVGHIHTDAEIVEDGIHYISTANSVMYMSDPNIVRNDGDKTELLMDVITINTEKRTVNLTRVGAGEDRSFNY